MSNYIRTDKVLDLLAGVVAEIIKMPSEEPEKSLWEKPARDLIEKRTIDLILGRPETHDNTRETHSCVCERTETHAEPERRGRWGFIGDQMLQCSECGHVFTQEFLEGWRGYIHEPFLPPYCPNCGAYMRGEQE